MPVSSATRNYQRQQVALRAVVYSDIRVAWRLLDPERLDDSFSKFATAAAAVVQARRETSATLARHYLEVRRAGLPGSPPLIPTPPLDLEALFTSLRITSVVSIKTAMTRRTPIELATRNALVRTLGTADKYVGDAGRELIKASIQKDALAKGWLRVTLGTCAYCADLAQEHHLKSGEAEFPRHDHCGCQPEPQYEPKLQPEQQYVDKISGMLQRGEVTEDQLRAALLDPNMKPLSKANIEAALDALEAERANVAAEVAQRAAEAALRASERGEGAFLSRGQYDALAPESAWSEEKRQAILTSLRETPEGRVLADTLERFQDGGSIARLRTKIDSYLAGQDIDATSRARAEALLNAIAHAPEDWAPETLYRGMTVKGQIDNVIAKYEVGGSIDLNLTSFSADRKVATRFQQMTSKGGRETRVMVELVGDGKKVIPIQNLPKDRRLFREKEWVSAGRYEIVSVKKSNGSILLRIKQIGTP